MDNGLEIVCSYVLIQAYTLKTSRLGTKRRRCGSCPACLRSDCGNCVFCKDKPKFGGPGTRKQCCEKKRCELLSTKSCDLPIAKKPCRSQSSITEFLHVSGRKLHHVIGDGSCLFRALAFALLGEENHGYFIRSEIVRLINFNKEVFTRYLMPSVNCKSIAEQVRHMNHPNSWGTHLEVVGAATLFQVPVYYCTQSSPSEPFTWGVFRPICSDRIRFPLIVQELIVEAQPIPHFELYYHQSLHYDAIVSTETGKICTTPPQLTGRDDPDIIDLS